MNPIMIIDGVPCRRCNSCGEYKPLTEFNKNGTRVNENGVKVQYYDVICRECLHKKNERQNAVSKSESPVSKDEANMLDLLERVDRIIMRQNRIIELIEKILQ